MARGRKPGRIENPKNIRKHLFVTELQNDKLGFIANKIGEYEAVIIRRALTEFIERYEASYGNIELSKD